MTGQQSVLVVERLVDAFQANLHHDSATVAERVIECLRILEVPDRDIERLDRMVCRPETVERELWGV